MSDAPEQEGAHGDVDHRLGHFEALLVVADEASPADHPADYAFADPASRDKLEAHRLVGTADALAVAPRPRLGKSQLVSRASVSPARFHARASSGQLWAHPIGRRPSSSV